MRTFRALLLIPILAPTSLQAAPPWQELWTRILGPAEGTIPADPGGKVVWRTDFAAALMEASKANRPVLVTWRCLPCKQCAEFDQNVLEGSETLDPLLRRFVTVRLTDAARLDERYFPYRTHQDLDLSWWGYFLSPEGDYYGVFGGKDHVSDSTRISEAAFVNSLRRVLAHHHDPRRADWKIDLPRSTASKKKSGPRDTRGYKLLLAKRPGLGKPHPEHGSCLHCHQVGDMMTMEALDAGTFTVSQFTGTWPLPENIGLYLDRDDGLLVDRVNPLSPAGAAGLKRGDRLGMANGTRLFGQADFRGVLHRAGPGADTLRLAWRRGEAVMSGEAALEPGWRKTMNWWRKTVYDGVYGPGMGFFPLQGPAFGKGQGLSVKPWMGPKPHERAVYQTGLRPNMEIIAIDDMKDDLPIRQLLTWFRLNHQPGDKVTYTVRDGTQYRFALPKEK
ncbi:MAG: hypothetical protein GWO24_14110 [Akkermansiaceae bacterium]|nr:hypothetical protein [Akkermansiaceae bacterium]